MPMINNNVSVIKKWLDQGGDLSKLLEGYSEGSFKVLNTSFQELKDKVDLILKDAPESLDTFKELAELLNNDKTGLEAILEQLEKKVDKDGDKVLSDENFTYDDKVKLDNLWGFDNHYIININANEIQSINDVLNKISETIAFTYSSKLYRVTVKQDYGDIMAPTIVDSILFESYEADIPSFWLIGNIPDGSLCFYYKADLWGDWQRIEFGGGGKEITIDSELSTTSTNPVQNKVITNALDQKVEKVEGKDLINYFEITEGGGYLAWEHLVNPDSTYTVPSGVSVIYSNSHAGTYEYGILISSCGDETTWILITPSGEIKRSIYDDSIGGMSPWEDIFSSSGGSNITIDSTLSLSSTNPVQNKVITAELNKKAVKDNAFDGFITVRENPLETDVFNQQEYTVRGVYKVKYSVSVDDYTTLSYIGLLIVEDETTSTDDYTEDMFLQTFISNQGIYHRRSIPDSYIDWQAWEKITVSQYDFDDAIGDIEATLDGIINIQNSLIKSSSINIVKDNITLKDSITNTNYNVYVSDGELTMSLESGVE